MLVGLAVVLNSIIYAENLATRTNQAEAEQITKIEQEAAGGASGAIEYHHNNNSSHSTYDDLEDGFNVSIDEWSSIVLRDSVRQGQYVDTHYTGTYSKGTRLAQDNDSTFEPQNASTLNAIVDIDNVDQWVVTPGANQVRGFRMIINRSELGAPQQRADTEAYLANLTLGGNVSLSSPPFAVAYDENDDDSLDHSVTIYNSSADSDDVNITYRNYDTNMNRTCTVEDAGSTVTLDISNGRVEGNTGDCREVFEFQSDMDPSQLIFVQGDQIGGDYEFIVHENTGAFETEYNSSLLSGESFGYSDYYDDHNDGHGSSYSPTSPYAEPAIYSAEVRVRYQTDTVNYNGTQTVIPDKP